MKRLFFLWLVLLSAHLQAQNIQGSWNGTLDVSGAKLRLVLIIASGGLEEEFACGFPDFESLAGLFLPIRSSKRYCEYSLSGHGRQWSS